MKALLSRPISSLVVLICLSLAVMVRFDRPLIRGDGVAYLAWLDTLVLDHDIDLSNQAERLQPVNTYHITWNDKTGRYVTVFPFGVAFLQAPFYLLGDFFFQHGWWNQNPDYFHRMQGVAQAYSLWVMIGANVMCLAAVILGWRIARYFTDHWTAALAAGVFFIGTPLFYYSTTAPLNSHNPGALMAAVFIYLLIRCTGAFQDGAPKPGAVTGWYWWAALGFSAGLMTLSRWQLILIAVPAWGILAWQRRWRAVLIAAVAAGITLLPLPLVWNELFGTPFTVPYDSLTDEPFLGLPVNAPQVFIASVLHSPVLFLSLMGIPFLWRVNRTWVLFTVTVVGLQVLINGAALDWYAGETFGMRRMSELYPAYVLLGAAFLGQTADLRSGRTRWAAVRLLGGRVFLGIMIPYMLLYILSFYVFTWSDAGTFTISPQPMITFFLNHPDPQGFIHTMFRTHLGPPAWSMPGP